MTTRINGSALPALSSNKLIKSIASATKLIAPQLTHTQHAVLARPGVASATLGLPALLNVYVALESLVRRDIQRKSLANLGGSDHGLQLPARYFH